MKKGYSWPSRTPGATEYEYGRAHGHNIVAQDYSYIADDFNTVAPGGDMLASQLGCHSCHDPHGRYRRNVDGTITLSGLPIKASGSYHNSVDPDGTNAVGVYRLLAGNGYKGIFAVDPPAAVVPSTYNRTESATHTRAAYGNGMGLWCASCHEEMHTPAQGKFAHPVADALEQGIVDNYNAYVKTGDLNGQYASAFTSLVPFEEGTADYAQLKAHARNDNTVLQGPDTSSKVMCLSCHRAHASGWEWAIRWNPEYELLTDNGAYPSSGYASRGHSQAEVQAAYYDRPATVFATYQRSLCNKCHVKD